MNPKEYNSKDDVTAPQGIEYTYKLLKGADGNLYVSVGPLMADISKSVDKMGEMNIDILSPENKQLFELKLLGLKTVYEFLGSLVTEQMMKDKAQKYTGNVPLNTMSSYSVMTDKVQ